MENLEPFILVMCLRWRPSSIKCGYHMIGTEGLKPKLTCVKGLKSVHGWPSSAGGRVDNFSQQPMQHRRLGTVSQADCVRLSSNEQVGWLLPAAILLTCNCKFYCLFATLHICLPGRLCNVMGHILPQGNLIYNYSNNRLGCKLYRFYYWWSNFLRPIFIVI